MITAVCALALHPSWAAERMWMQYSEIAELFDKFTSIPAERRAGLDFRVKV
ncbi:MAG: hypothetical protein LH480_03035 [Rubrivivax sp.]|nr:hypothetical protein [Rubrivivax sp.]